MKQFTHLSLAFIFFPLIVFDDLHQEEANKLIGANSWTDMANKSISDKSRNMIEKTYVFTPGL